MHLCKINGGCHFSLLKGGEDWNCVIIQGNLIFSYWCQSFVLDVDRSFQEVARSSLEVTRSFEEVTRSSLEVTCSFQDVNRSSQMILIRSKKSLVHSKKSLVHPWCHSLVPRCHSFVLDATRSFQDVYRYGLLVRIRCRLSQDVKNWL